MNHLAHSFLSCEDPDLLIGNLIADFLSKKEADELSSDFQMGLALHRHIDKFMDGHVLTKAAIQILKPSQKKYAPVSIDLLWDHFLCIHWDRYTDQSYEDYCSYIYEMIMSNIDKLSQNQANRFKKLISYNFIGQYKSEKDFKAVLLRMDQRANYPSNFKGLLDASKDAQHELDDLFNNFFPEAIGFAQDFCSC